VKKVRIGTGACLVAGLAATLCAAGAVRANEGMWTYNHPPQELMQQLYGFTPTQAWLDHLRLSSVSPGASAAFVSPDGLILTNHHVARGMISRVSTPEHNYVRDGFTAASRDQEIPLPGNTVHVLVSIEDITARVQGAVRAGLDPAAARKAREAQIAAIEAECAKKTGLRGEVVALYGGARYDLYRYKEYTDIRLVCSPEQQAAYFGGDYDNFCYPRHDLDFSFLRAYENGKPARVSDYLKINPEGIKDGEMVIVSGNPGRTDRLRTLAYIDYQRETFPDRVARTRHQLELVRSYMARGAEQRRRGLTLDNGLSNTLKRSEGEFAALQQPELRVKKAAEEKALRDAVAADPKLQAQYGAAWDHSAAAYDWARAHEKDRLYRREMPGSRFFSTTVLSLVRYQAEVAKPDKDRLPSYHESNLPDVLRRLQSPAPVYKDLEEVMAADSFQRLLDGLGPEDPLVVAVLQGKTPAEAAKFYLDGTKLDDVAVRQALLKDKGKAIAKSDDPLIALARRVDPLLRETDKAWRDNVDALEDDAGTQIALARFAVYGDKAYPDATGTLRFGFGKVTGYPEATTLVPPFTTFLGLYDRALSFGDSGDFALAPAEREHRGDVDLNGVLNFACTADITAGNSGSPLGDREGRFVGVAFDGNVESHANRFVYSETRARCVCLDVRAILQALTKLYHAQSVADEMLAAAAQGGGAAPAAAAATATGAAATGATAK